MSASTEKKNRQIGRADGTDKRTIAERKEAEKRAKDKLKWTIVGIAVVIFVAAVIFLNSGLFYRTATALKIDNPANTELGIAAGSEKFSIAEVSYAYNRQFITLVNNMGEYTSIYGLDTSKSLKEQECTLFRPEELAEEESYTWHDYMLESARHELREISALCAYAKANNIALDADELKELDDSMAELGDLAKQYGWGSADKFLAGNYGMGCNVKLANEMSRREALAQKVLTTISESFSYTAAELSEKYDSVKDSYDLFAYDYYLVNAEKVETTDADGNVSTAVNDDTMAKAKEDADAIVALIGEGKSFATALTTVIPEVTVDAYTDAEGVEHEAETKAPEVTSNSDVAGASIEYAISEWLTAAGRKAKDVEVIEADGTGYYVVVFGSRRTNTDKTEESGDLSYCDYVADSLLRSEGLTAWQEDVFEGLEATFAATDCFALKYVSR